MDEFPTETESALTGAEKQELKVLRGIVATKKESPADRQRFLELSYFHDGLTREEATEFAELCAIPLGETMQPEQQVRYDELWAKLIKLQFVRRKKTAGR